MSVPSTEKCSSERRSAALAWRSTAAKKRWATSPLSSRSRFLLKTVGSQTGSSALRPTNQRKRMSASSCSIKRRSLRTE